MTPSSSPPVPSDPACALCSKPIRSGGFIQIKVGEVVHIRCRSRQLQLDALNQVDQARLALERATDLVEETRRRRIAQTHNTPLAAGSLSGVCRAGDAIRLATAARLDDRRGLPV